MPEKPPVYVLLDALSRKPKKRRGKVVPFVNGLDKIEQMPNAEIVRELYRQGHTRKDIREGLEKLKNLVAETAGKPKAGPNQN